MMGRTIDALAQYNAAIAADPNDAAYGYSNRGGLYGKMGDFTHAIPDLLRAVELKPDLADAYYNLGIIYHQTGQYDKALEAETNAINYQYGNPLAVYYNRGLVYFDMGQFERAIDDFTMALAYNPYFTRALVWRGNAYDNIGENDLALADYAQIIAIDPTNEYAYYNRGLLYLNEGDYENALHDFKQAVALNPNDTSAQQGVELAQDGLRGQQMQATPNS
jgi:tetratricopeptide (TPR) repeat protein